jgi:hypothetical protein
MVYGYGRGGEDRATPHLLPAAAYRRGTHELRAAIRESIGGILRQRPLAPELKGALDILRVIPIASAQDDVMNLLRDRGGEDGVLLDRVAAVLSLLGPSDEAFWADLVLASPRPAVVQAAVRAIGRFDASGSMRALARWLEWDGVQEALPAVGLLLPALREAWTEQRPGEAPATWWRAVDGLPASARAAMEPTLTLLRKAEPPVQRTPDHAASREAEPAPTRRRPDPRTDSIPLHRDADVFVAGTHVTAHPTEVPVWNAHRRASVVIVGVSWAADLAVRKRKLVRNADSDRVRKSLAGAIAAPLLGDQAAKV